MAILVWESDGSQVWQGHVLEELAGMAAGSVQCVVTSPPYWGLRDYGLEGMEWPPVRYAPLAGVGEIEVPGWRGSLGLEPTVEMYVGHLVLVWRALRRVLREDGVCWLNLGDSYTSGNRNGHGARVGYKQQTNRGMCGENDPERPRQVKGLKAKDLIGIPWRVALALQADGWWLRSDVIWAKGISFCKTYSGSCMPESVGDRPSKGHEYVFLLSRAERYFYDGDAVREESATGWNGSSFMDERDQAIKPGLGMKEQDERSGRNLRTVWAINPRGYAGAHFATFPTTLVEPMIQAGTSERGCCPACGAPWERVTDKEFIPQEDVSLEKGIRGSGEQKPLDQSDNREGFPRGSIAVRTIDWRAGCSCRVNGREPVPCVVLDPFGGSGTVGEVAIKLGRRFRLIELSEVYCREHIVPRVKGPIQLALV